MKGAGLDTAVDSSDNRGEDPMLAGRPMGYGRPDGKSIAALVAVQVLFGLHYLAAKVLVQTIPPRPWALIRAAVSGLILLAYVRFRGMPLPRGRTLLKFFGLALIGVAINQWLFVEGLSRTTPGHSALINTSIPVVVLLIAVGFGRERPTPRRLAGIATTLLGVLVLIGPDRLDFRSEAFWGDLLTLVNALSYSLFLVVSKPILEREGTVTATSLFLALGALWLVPVGAPGLLALDFAAVPARVWLLGAFIVLAPTIAAYGLNMYALRRVESSIVALFVYLQPVIGVGLSLALGFERPTLRLFAAATIVFCGLYVALRAPARQPLPAAPIPEP